MATDKSRTGTGRKRMKWGIWSYTAVQITILMSQSAPPPSPTWKFVFWVPEKKLEMWSEQSRVQLQLECNLVLMTLLHTKHTVGRNRTTTLSTKHYKSPVPKALHCTRTTETSCATGTYSPSYWHIPVSQPSLGGNPIRDMGRAKPPESCISFCAKQGTH